MDWGLTLLKETHGVVTVDNIEKFNMEFWSELNNEHDSDIPDGEYCEFNITMWGLKFQGHYTAVWIGDEEYPNETEPYDIELDYIDDEEVA